MMIAARKPSILQYAEFVSETGGVYRPRTVRGVAKLCTFAVLFIIGSLPENIECSHLYSLIHSHEPAVGCCRWAASPGGALRGWRVERLNRYARWAATLRGIGLLDVSSCSGLYRLEIPPSRARSQPPPVNPRCARAGLALRPADLPRYHLPRNGCAVPGFTSRRLVPRRAATYHDFPEGAIPALTSGNPYLAYA